MNSNDFDHFILSNMPHFIAVNYQRLLNAKTPQEYVEYALHIYDLGLRSLTLGLVSQYLIRDRDAVSDPYLNDLLLQKFPHLTLDAWQQLFFTTLKVYEGNREFFFIPELYDFYWDTTTLPHTPRTDVERPFTRLTQIFLEMNKAGILPQHETEWSQLAAEIQHLLGGYLHAFAFLAHYDLIRIVHSDAKEYHFEWHKGLHITPEIRALPSGMTLNPGCFLSPKAPRTVLAATSLSDFMGRGGERRDSHDNGYGSL